MSIWPTQFSTFTPQECRAMLATEHSGRLVVTGQSRRRVAVHYDVDGDAILVHGGTGEADARVSLLPGASARLEVDHYDLSARAGWKVIARGVLEGGSPPAGESDTAPAVRLRVRQLRGHLVLAEPLYPSFRLNDPAFA